MRLARIGDDPARVGGAAGPVPERSIYRVFLAQAVTSLGLTVERVEERQEAVVEALRQGKANKIIAYELNMQESTVKVHVRNIMKKLNAKNRTEVAYLTRNMFDDD